MGSNSVSIGLTSAVLCTVAIAGAFIASAVCPVMTAVSALALGFFSGVSFSGLCVALSKPNPQSVKIAGAVLAALALPVGLVAMSLLGIPFSFGAVAATVGFSLLLFVGGMAIAGTIGACRERKKTLFDFSLGFAFINLCQKGDSV